MRKVANAQYHDFGCGVSVVGLKNEDNFYLKMIKWKGFFFEMKEYALVDVLC